VRGRRLGASSYSIFGKYVILLDKKVSKTKSLGIQSS
jgi:hypothetical protein